MLIIMWRPVFHRSATSQEPLYITFEFEDPPVPGNLDDNPAVTETNMTFDSRRPAVAYPQRYTPLMQEALDLLRLVFSKTCPEMPPCSSVVAVASPNIGVKRVGSWTARSFVVVSETEDSDCWLGSTRSSVSCGSLSAAPS